MTPAFTNVTVRPAPYDAGRISPSQLEDFAGTHAVRLRGWPVPMLSNRDPVAHHGNWIAQDLQAEIVPHLEAWRLFTSGQFVQRRVIATDLRDAAELKAEAPEATGAVAVWDILLYLVEVAELGARYATALGAETVTIDVSLENIAGRELISGSWDRELHGRTSPMPKSSPRESCTPRRRCLRRHGLLASTWPSRSFGSSGSTSPTRPSWSGRTAPSTSPAAPADRP